MNASSTSSHRIAALTTQLPGALLVAVVLGQVSAHADAQARVNTTRPSGSASASRTLADLEQDFWACEYAAATRWVSGGEGATCVTVYEALKQRKFGGDFQVLLGWWQQRKAAEHRARAAESRAVTPAQRAQRIAAQ